MGTRTGHENHVKETVLFGREREGHVSGEADHLEGDLHRGELMTNHLFLCLSGPNMIL